MTDIDYAKLVQEVVEEYRSSPVDLLNTGDSGGEFAYLNSHRDSYVRTVRDINLFCGNAGHIKRVLEIGSFLGPVSFALKRIGYDVQALDIPEFHKSNTLQALYEKNGVPFCGLNLRCAKLPYESGSLDAVIMCEVLEHLNFNPLPVLQEINRILKPGGLIYIGMPNQSWLRHRLRLLFGRSIHNTIDDFFLQLDKRANMIAGLHWREYTVKEALQMINAMNFESIASYYFVESGASRAGAFRNWLRRIMYFYPAFRPYQVVIGRKIADAKFDFWRTEVNS